MTVKKKKKKPACDKWFGTTYMYSHIVSDLSWVTKIDELKSRVYSLLLRYLYTIYLWYLTIDNQKS